MTEEVLEATALSPEVREGLVFVGQTLGPLFLHDPALEREVVWPLYEALAGADARALAEEWPFVAADDIEPALAALIAGLRFDDRESGAEAAALQGSAVHEDLVWEYRRLFVGPGAKAAPPWGSVYTDKDQVVFGQATLDLREWLRANAVAVVKRQSDEPEDHIGTMLELLAWLAEHRSQLVRPYLEQHLLPWAPHFLELMETASDQPFFQGLARTTALTLGGIQHDLDLAVEVPRFYR